MFALNIAISGHHLELMKNELIRGLPQVKSSHRWEALARGFRFQTYAAMRAALMAAPPTIGVDGAAFTNYLEAKGYCASYRAIYRLAAKIALCEIMATTPKLTCWGIGVGEWRRGSDGTWESAREYEDRFNASRRDLLHDSSADQFLLSLALLTHLPKTKTPRPGVGSYRVKHIVENYPYSYPDSDLLGPIYVANGLTIAAAIHLGILYKTFKTESGRDHLNVALAVSQRVVDDLDCQFRPDGARAQQRRRRQELRILRRNHVWVYP